MPLALITWLDTGSGSGPPGIWGPTDPRPGYGLPTPQPPLGMWGPNDPRPTHPIAPGGQQPRPDQGLPGNQPYPDQGLPGNQPYPGQGLPPFATNLPVVPPQQPIVDPGDPNKAYIVAYYPKPGGGAERITFTVELPDRAPPTEATPKA